MFPEDSLQGLFDNWWEKHPDSNLERGCLIRAFLPHVDQTPYSFKPLGRSDPKEHSNADIIIEPLTINQRFTSTPLPVAAMTQSDSELWAAYKAKRRYCIVLGNVNATPIEKQLTRGKPNSSTAPTILVAPFYGVATKTSRAGYNPVFVERVRHCEYPQFHWDILPIPRGEESILRLDHTQPIGAHYKSYEQTGFKLSEEAMSLLDDQFSWLFYGGVPKDSLLLDYRALIEETFTD